MRYANASCGANRTSRPPRSESDLLAIFSAGVGSRAKESLPARTQFALLVFLFVAQRREEVVTDASDRALAHETASAYSSTREKRSWVTPLGSTTMDTICR